MNCLRILSGIKLEARQIKYNINRDKKNTIRPGCK